MLDFRFQSRYCICIYIYVCIHTYTYIYIYICILGGRGVYGTSTKHRVSRVAFLGALFFLTGLIPDNFQQFGVAWTGIDLANWSETGYNEKTVPRRLPRLMKPDAQVRCPATYPEQYLDSKST